MMNLLAALYWFDEALQTAMEQEGFPPTVRVHSLVLMNMAIGETRPTRIARNLGVTRQAVSQLIAQMVAEGRISVGIDPDDKRARILQFNENSTAIRSTAMSILKRLEGVLGERIGVANLSALSHSLALEWGDPPALAAKLRSAGGIPNVGERLATPGE